MAETNQKTEQKTHYVEEDVIKERVDHLIEDRLPWLSLGVLGGLLATVIVSKYEAILAADVRLAFFMPIIVYLSDAVGTQTETIYVRELAQRKKINVARYFFKESLVGFWLGIGSGLVLGIFAAWWLHSLAIGAAIGLTMLVNLTLSPLFAVFIPSILYRRRTDPALGSGPVATIIQDLISLMVYFFMASMIIF